MDNLRFLLFIALAFTLLLLWQAWEQQNSPPVTPTAQSASPAADAGVPSAPSGSAGEKGVPTVAAATVLARGERVEVVTDLMRAEIDTHGGDLRSLWLLKYPVAADKPNEPFALLQETDPAELYIAQSGIIGHEREYPTHNVRYTAESRRYELRANDSDVRVPLSWRAPDGVRYTKTYIFKRNSYVVDVEFSVNNASSKPWSGFLYAQFVRSHVETGGLFALPTYTGGAIYTLEDHYQKISLEDMAKKSLERDSTGGWVAMLQHYFVGAWIGASDGRYQFYSRALSDQRFNLGLRAATPTEVAPGQTGKLNTALYLGPKEQARLEQVAPGLELTVDYGWLTIIAAPLFWLLAFIHKWVGNWGWAIILLTILIKLAFYPLSAASYRSMAHMKKVQPKLQALKERYGDDRQKMSQAMMELYKTEKINPLGGCLPILIQIPVFIALYWVLLDSVEMRHAPFVLWIEDLSSKDPYYVLPLIMGVSMYLQQLLNPQPPDPIQRRVFMAMPVIFTVLFLFFPAGLVLYWVVNNILSIAQQWYITRSMEAKAS